MPFDDAWVLVNVEVKQFNCTHKKGGGHGLWSFLVSSIAVFALFEEFLS